MRVREKGHSSIGYQIPAEKMDAFFGWMERLEASEAKLDLAA
jgi:hypothetical protein